VSQKQLPEYEVMPDITYQKNTTYRVVRVLTRNEKGDITKFEEVRAFPDHGDAQLFAQKMNNHTERD
jgi:hypothetical protein